MLVLMWADSQDNDKRCHLNSYLFASYTVGRIKHNVVSVGRGSELIQISQKIMWLLQRQNSRILLFENKREDFVSQVMGTK